MVDSRPSTTALFTAILRGLHRLEDDAPWVFDDPYALTLVGAEWPDVLGRLRGMFREPVMRAAMAGILARARYTDDQAASGAFEQYVLLGAGLDSFAWRRPDLLRALRLFEVDHPSSHAFKRERIDALALPDMGAAHRLVPVDFQSETLTDALKQHGFDWAKPSLFAMLGVAVYLDVESIASTLRTVASAGSGSRIVFTYGVATDLHDAPSRELLDLLTPIAEAAGEPLQTFLAPADLEHLVERSGLRLLDHPTRDEIQARYFGDRSDDLRMWTLERIVLAEVP